MQSMRNAEPVLKIVKVFVQSFEQSLEVRESGFSRSHARVCRAATKPAEATRNVEPPKRSPEDQRSMA